MTYAERLEVVIAGMSDDEQLKLIADMKAGKYNELLPERVDRLEREYGKEER